MLQTKSTRWAQAREKETTKVMSPAKLASGRRNRRNIESESTISYIQIDGLVVLKIIKHCQEEGAGVIDVAQGVLVGLGVDGRLEITNCFPIPRHTDDEDFDEMEYQVEMMRRLRNVNADHLHIGWYQSTPFGNFFNKPFVESQFTYQNSIEESVVVIYDPVKTTRGFLSLKAYRLTPAAMKLYKEGEFSPEMLQKIHISYQNVYEEIPVLVRNSHLINVMLCELSEFVNGGEGKQFLDMGAASVLERTLQSLMECVDSVSQESNKLTSYQRQVLKQQQAKHQYTQKRAQENASRAAKGEPPQPEEDINKLFKPVPPPSRLDALLVCGQINTYCQQMSQFASQNIGKLFIAEALQQDKALQ